MAKIVLTDCVISIDSNDISDHVASATLNYNADVLETTAMGDSSRTRIGGLKDWSLDLELHQDYADDNIDEILFDLVGTTFTVTIQPASGSKSASNPSYEGTGILPGYAPINGAVGALATTSISIQGSGTLTRDITA